ncbi:hypothetical protein [Photobacterium leiognathi]|uniref:hypothetical protein n=1 Tax=Photobacterium leiognathi TaxID=553611 RepID=UPI002981A265|nr:hypothetical protein [Photobacterium leiognathi]
MLSVPNMTKGKLKKHILLAIEVVVGNPIKNRRNAIANRAMATILFGNDKTGNQHNADIFFSEDPLPLDAVSSSSVSGLTEFQRLDLVLRQVENSPFYGALPESSMIMDIMKYARSEHNYYEFVWGFSEYIKVLEIANGHLANPVNGNSKVNEEVIAILACNRLLASAVCQNMQGILPSATLRMCKEIARE